MIPIVQGDYFKYLQMFRGNFLKGATLFRAMLNTPEVQEQLMETLPALAAVFTDFHKTEANRLCYDILKQKPYFETAVMNYLRGLNLTEHDTMEELLGDTGDFFAALKHDDANAIFQDCTGLLRRGLLKRQNCHALAERANTALILREDMLDDLSAVMTRNTVALNSTLTSYFNSSLYGKTTPFASSEIYYGLSTISYEAAELCENPACVFLPVMLYTRLNSSNTYYYYPSVFRYDIEEGAWSLLYVASTAQKQTSTNYNSRMANGLAYDEEHDRLYVFYKAVYSSPTVFCDIVDGTTGVEIRKDIEVGSVGNYSLYAPYYCTFDTEAGLAKYVWMADEINVGTASACGWLYGCAVGASGLVWSDKVSHPRADYSSIYSNYLVPFYSAPRQFLRGPCGAIVGVFQTGSNVSTSQARMILLKPEGNKVQQYALTFDTGTDYGALSNPASYAMTEDGLVALAYTGITWAGTAQSVALVLDLNAVPRIVYTYTQSRSYAFNVGVAALFNKPAFTSALSDAWQTAVGVDETGRCITNTYAVKYSLFTTPVPYPRRCKRYKLNSYNLYDYEGSLTA